MITGYWLKGVTRHKQSAGVDVTAPVNFSFYDPYEVP